MLGVTALNVGLPRAAMNNNFSSDGILRHSWMVVYHHHRCLVNLSGAATLLGLLATDIPRSICRLYNFQVEFQEKMRPCNKASCDSGGEKFACVQM